MTSLSTPRYVPILKGRRGEFDALRDLTLPSRKYVYPLVEILPNPEEQPNQRDVDKALNTLALRWSTEPIMLDVGYFDLDPVDGRTPLRVVMDAARSMLGGAVPVIRLADTDQVRQDAAQAAEQDKRGLAIRIVGDDLDEDPDDISEHLEEVIAGMSLSTAQIDLLLDLGPVQGNVAVVGGSRLLVSLLRGLAHLSEYRSVTVASGAFPVDLSGVAPWTLGEHPRGDAALYNRIRQRPLPRTIDYGDYAIAHPLLTTGVAFSPPPQLRYTVSDRWLTMKAKRNDPRGNAQFFDVSAVIAQHPDFCGAELGSADRRIAEGRGGGHGPGNATTWRTIGTTHHVDLVVSRLTSFGEP